MELEEFFRQLRSFPPDVSVLPHPDIDHRGADEYCTTLLNILENNDSPAARHTILQAAAYVGPLSVLEETALAWAKDPEDADPLAGRAIIVQYCCLALTETIFSAQNLIKILADPTVSHSRARDILITWSRQDFQSFVTACTSQFNIPITRAAIVQLVADSLLDFSFEPTDMAASTDMAKLVSYPFVDHLLRSLMFDTDNHLFSIGLRLLLIILPYAPLLMSNKVPLMVVVLGRAILWRDRPFVDHGSNDRQGVTRTPLPRSDLGWDVATNAMTPSLRLPQQLAPRNIAQLYLISLYGAWPSNVIAFTRDPASYIRGKRIPSMYSIEWEEVWERGILAARVEPLIRDFRLHPSLVVFTSAAELADDKRWDKIDPSEYIARSQALANANFGGVTQVDLMRAELDLDTEDPVDDDQVKRENELLRLEAKFTARVRKQYLHHIGRLHKSSLRLNNDEAEIHSFVNRLKEQAKEIAALSSELSQQRTDAAQAQQRHLKWQTQLREKVTSFKEEKAAWQSEAARIRGELGEARATTKGQQEELAMVKNERFKLQSRLAEAEPKIRHISDYETTIKQLTESQRLWEEDVKRCKEAREESESWRAKCFEMDQQLRAAQNEVATQAQTISQLERRVAPSVKVTVKDEQLRPRPARDLTFYATLLDEAKVRVDKIERENLELRLKLDAVKNGERRTNDNINGGQPNAVL